MKRFDYIRPATLAEALEAGAAPGAAFYAGGTNLLDLMKTGAATPDRLVDVSRLPELDRIETEADGALRIGAMARNADMARDPRVLAAHPILAEALLSGASAQLRNAATLGGNLMQRTRCPWYFAPEAACGRRDPGAGCAARDAGVHLREHAVLGWSEGCIATHPSDLCVALAALDPVVEIAGPVGVREIPFADLHRLPGETPHRTHALAPGELILAIRIPAHGFGRRQRYLKLRERTSFAFALVSAAAMLRIEEDRIVEARIAIGGVAAKPWRCAAAEEALIGRAASPAAFEDSAAAAIPDATPSGDNGFKIGLARRLTARALAAAAAGAPERMPALPGSLFDATMEAAHA